MTEITTYDEFKGLSEQEQDAFFAVELFGWRWGNNGTHDFIYNPDIRIPPCWKADGRVGELFRDWNRDWLDYKSPNGSDAIKQAMIGLGYEYLIEYKPSKRDSGMPPAGCMFWKHDQGMRFTHHAETESEAVNHAAAKALLGGK